MSLIDSGSRRRSGFGRDRLRAKLPRADRVHARRRSSVLSASTRATAVATARPLTILRFADLQRSALQVGAVQRLHGAGCVGIRHLHEAEAARATGVTIGDQGDLLDGSMRGKQGAYDFIGCGEGKISDI